MARVYDTIDFFYSSDGDFDVDEKGDIQDTSYDPLRSVHQQIEKRLKGVRGDWQLNKDIGANLDKYVGMRNTRQIGIEISSATNNALLQGNLIDPRDLAIRVAPISPEMIAIKVDLSHAQTLANQDSLPVTKIFVYDYRDNNVYAAGTKKFSPL